MAIEHAEDDVRMEEVLTEESEQYLYNAWLPVAQESRTEKHRFHEVVSLLQLTWKPHDLDTRFATLKWIPVISMYVLSFVFGSFLPSFLLHLLACSPSSITCTITKLQLQTITKLWLWTITILTIASIMTLIAQTIDPSQLSLHPSAWCCDDLFWVQFSHILLGFYWFVQFNQFLVMFSMVLSLLNMKNLGAHTCLLQFAWHWIKVSQLKLMYFFLKNITFCHPTSL